MKKIAFYDSKPYDKTYFDKMAPKYGFEINYFDFKLNSQTAFSAIGSDGVCIFVNDEVDSSTIDILQGSKVGIAALRCSGFNNVDLRYAQDKLCIVRVPAYSPHAVAEHAMALLLTLNRKTHRAYNRTREHNFSLSGLMGFDLCGKTVGVIGTGRIGKAFIEICKGFGMNVLAYDPYPDPELNLYTSLENLFKQSDIISLHCPLTRDTHHMINNRTISQMKPGVILINTSRGAIVDSDELFSALKAKKIGGACLDVYEEEEELFYEDLSNIIIEDEVISGLISLPNVIITSHQAFFTVEALHKIAETTLINLRDYFDGKPLENEVKSVQFVKA